jgi:hypothetical protein
VIGGVERKSYIQMMEKEAEESAAFRRIRVIVPDNGPIHRGRQSPTIMVEVGKSGFIHLAFA